MYTYDELIHIRQNEIFNEIRDIEEEVLRLRTEIEKLEALKKRRLAEYDMLQHVNDKGLVDNERKVSRLDFEAALRRIFDKAGRPLAIGELIDRLEEFGYIYSNYHSAYNRLRSLGILEPTGARGYYNLLK